MGRARIPLTVALIKAGLAVGKQPFALPDGIGLLSPDDPLPTDEVYRTVARIPKLTIGLSY